MKRAPGESRTFNNRIRKPLFNILKVYTFIIAVKLVPYYGMPGVFKVHPYLMHPACNRNSLYKRRISELRDHPEICA